MHPDKKFIYKKYKDRDTLSFFFFLFFLEESIYWELNTATPGRPHRRGFPG
jgi:hypothetical protein